MFDELERLGETEPLFDLLAHYARAGADDREAWQDRLMQMEGVRAEELVKLHGELIAYDWVEQNTGALPAVRAGAVPQCYRVTPAGLRAFRHGMTRRAGKAAA
jgi:hypothetical protein